MDTRLEQYSFLETVLRTSSKKFRHRSLPPSLFLWGLPNTGKTFVLDKCLNKSRIRYQLYIDSTEVICGWKILLQSIVYQLYEKTGQLDETKNLKSCDGLDTFIRQIQDLTRTVLKQEPVVIVVDHADILRGHDNILQLFIRLAEFTEHNFCSVLLSHVPWRCYSHVIDCPVPLQLHFPQYTSSEIIQIIMSCPPANSNLTAFEFYVTMAIQVYSSTRDLMSLWKLVKARQSEFLERFSDPLEKPTESDLHNLWCKTFQPLLREELRTSRGGTKFGPTKNVANVNNIPTTVAYLMLAAFIASLNPSSTDRQIFVKGKTSSGKLKRIEGKEVKSGRSGVPQSRILAIFTHLSNSKFLPDTTLISTFQDLCNMKFLSRIGKDTSLDEPKYRVNISGDLAEQLSSIVKVSLNEVLVHRY